MILLLFKVVLIVSYVTIFFELTFLHVPSVASSVNIWNPQKDILNSYSDKYKSVFLLPKWKKILLFFVPLVIIFCTYIFPILTLFNIDNIEYLYQPRRVIYIASILLMVLGRYITFSSVLTIRKSNDQIGDSFSLHIFENEKSWLDGLVYSIFWNLVIDSFNLFFNGNIVLYRIYAF